MTGDLLKLPKPLRIRVQAELQPGERVRYAGRPDWRAQMGKDIVVFIFGLAWSSIVFPAMAFALISVLGLSPEWLHGNPIPRTAGIILFLFLVPFVLIGAVMLMTPFVEGSQRRRTVHAVTDKRILTVLDGKKSTTESYPLTTIIFVRRKDRRNGTGSLEIGHGVGKDADGGTRPITMNWYGIPDAKRAERALEVGN